eukprot:129937-Prymnesium_polylepis.1
MDTSPDAAGPEYWKQLTSRSHERAFQKIWSRFEHAVSITAGVAYGVCAGEGRGGRRHGPLQCPF